MTKCSIDLRVGGDYHQVFVTDDGTECSFRGTYLEIEPPTRTVERWMFEGVRIGTPSRPWNCTKRAE